MIALGGLLPGIGGAMAKAGTVEALYVAELAGLLLIWAGYEFCIRAGRLERVDVDDRRPVSRIGTVPQHDS